MNPVENNSAVFIRPWQEEDQEQVIAFILRIQQLEFAVPITIRDQPDLLNIDSFYRQGNGNFWCALSENKVVGTIALIDIGNQQGVIRKMFVDENFRGKEKKTAQLLLDELTRWAQSHRMDELFLGTIDKMIAARKFYLRNGFSEISKKLLPPAFPVMAVDNLFFRKELNESKGA